MSEGQGAAEIADNLLKAEVIKSTAAFTSVVNANSTTLYPGTFTLKKHMAASKVIDVLSDTNQAAGFLEVRPGERATDVFANAAKLSGIAQSEFDTIIKNKGKAILPNEAGGSFEGWLEPNEMSLLSAILEPGIPAGEHRGELQEYINTIRMQRVKDGTITQAGEDPLLTFGRIKKQNAGGQTI